MTKKSTIFITTFILLTLFITGCIKVDVKSFDGGIFKSADAGKQWGQKAELLRLPGQENFLNNVDVTLLIFDPQDSGTLYLGTKRNGLFVSFDAAETWERVRRLPNGNINSIVVHPRAKHIVYVAIDNQIFNSRDANRTWQNVYLDAVPDVEISALAIDPDLPSRIYSGLSDGRVIKSEDSGTSWQPVYDLRGKIKQIMIDPGNARVLYITTEGQGVFRSDDQGVNWQSLDESLSQFPSGREVIKLIFDTTSPHTLISANNYGLLKTNDGGDTWSEYGLLVSGSQLKIYSVAINPHDSNIIYYLTTGMLYKSLDGGQNWTTKTLSSKRIPSVLLIDPVNPNILYLGVTK